MEDFGNEVVGKIFIRHGVVRDVTRSELSAAFTKVQNKENWKLPVSCVITLKGDDKQEEISLIREAVCYYTGSIPEFYHIRGNTYRVEAAGYYSTIGM